MAILNVRTDSVGAVGVDPRIIYITTSDSLSTITTAGYLNAATAAGWVFDPADIAAITYIQDEIPVSQFFSLTFSASGVITLVPSESDVTLPVVADHLVMFSDSNGGIEDSGIDKSTVILTSKTGGQTAASSTSSAAAGSVYALTGSMTTTASPMTSGTLAGARGQATCEVVTGGSLYGTQGKVIAGDIVSGTTVLAPIFGQFDVSGAVINGASCSAIWGDWGATGANDMDLSKCRGVAFTNTTTNILNSQIYLYGGATNLLEIVDNNAVVGATYVTTPAGSTPSGALRTLTVSINGATYKILAAATYS